MNAPSVLVIVFAAVALGLSAFALWVALGARRDAREALDAAHRHTRPGVPEPRTERREEDTGPPAEQPERRRRHAAPETGRYAQLRAAADARESQAPAPPEPEPATTAIPVVRPDEDDLATREHPAPDARFRRPPPPLPPPGAITHPRP